MAYVLNITGPGGTFPLSPKTNKATLTKRLGETSATLDLSCHSLTENHPMDTVTLTVDGILRYSGIVKDPSHGRRETTKVSSLNCFDNTDKLHRRIVAESFDDKTPKEMVESLANKYAPWLTTTNVKDIGPAVESQRFDYITLAQAFQDIAEMTGAYWNIDEADDLHFFLDNDGACPFDYNGATNILKDSFVLNPTAQDLANRIWVIGPKVASSTYVDQYWTGDGNNDSWKINYEPNYPEVFEGGVEKTIEVDKGSASSKDYTYDKKNQVLKRTAGVLGNGVSLRLHHRPTVQVIDYFEDPASIKNYGLYEKVIRDRKITDKAAARKRGRAALKKRKAVQNKVNWQTKQFWGVSPGQVTNLTVTSFGISGKYLITGITIDLFPVENEAVASIEAVEVV